MPGIVHYTPPWLSRPSPGFQLFAQPRAARETPLATKPSEQIPQHRLNKPVAHRGTEVFVACGREIRWSDLILLRDDWDTRQRPDRGFAEVKQDDFSYRTLKVSVAGPIRQLIVSPDGEHIAILTSHTAHVAILPDASHLTSQDTNTIKLKTFQIGPTSHVRENPPIASAIWHPLAASGSTLVTVTTDAVVRLWEFERANRWSFDTPTLAIDLRKLANGAPSVDRLTPSKPGSNRGYTPDSFEMEVASACFGPSEPQSKHLWSPATLWVAMTEGDVYALCPLLPSKIVINESQIAGLAMQQECEQLDDLDGSETGLQRRNAAERYQWIEDILAQSATGDAQRTGYYKAPLKPGPVPMLQGPVRFTPDDDSIVDITDIAVLSLSALELDVDEELADGSTASPVSSTSVIMCLALDDGSVKLAVSLDGPQAKWFRPTKSSPGKLRADRSAPQFILAESIAIEDDIDESPLMFTRDQTSSAAIFVNSISGVTHLSPAVWASKLMSELEAGVDQNAGFRMDVLLDDISSATKQIVKFSDASSSSGESLNACIAVVDSDVGHFVLTFDGDQPYATQIEIDPDQDGAAYPQHVDMDDWEEEDDIARELRPSYQPPSDLWTDPLILGFLQKQPAYSRHSREKELKMSPHNLGLVMEAHRIISQDTTRLSAAAADMFRRCERLQAELKEQIHKTREATERIDSILDEEEDDNERDDGKPQNVVGVQEVVEKRLEAVKTRQTDLLARHENLRRKVAQLSRRPLTDKDRSWISEIKKMGEQVSIVGEEAEQGEVSLKAESTSERQLEQRFNEAKQVLKQLNSQMPDPNDTTEPPQDSLSDHLVSPEKRKQRKAQIDAMLERQDALIEATTSRLESLSTFDYGTAH